jgi:tetratricopeptide (TPR) repeat protein
MTNENEKNPIETKVEGIESALNKAEFYIEKNQKILTIIVLSLIGVVGLYFLVMRFYWTPREDKAMAQMYVAEHYFEVDSIKKALNGDGNYPGFLTIIEDYGMTKAASLAHYYAGICYKSMGKYNEAIEYLEKFDGSDRTVANVAIGSIGDCYAELGNTDKAIDYYKKAADNVVNNYTTPIYLLRAGVLLESKNEYKQALELYERIQKDFYRSMEGQQAAKYIARVKTKGNIQ